MIYTQFLTVLLEGETGLHSKQSILANSWMRCKSESKKRGKFFPLCAVHAFPFHFWHFETQKTNFSYDFFYFSIFNLALGRFNFFLILLSGAYRIKRTEMHILETKVLSSQINNVLRWSHAAARLLFRQILYDYLQIFSSHQKKICWTKRTNIQLFYVKSDRWVKIVKIFK